jgi:hypothetical protein
MTRRLITQLEDHPNVGEILGVLAQLAHVADSDLPLLADAWTNNTLLAGARDRSLSPDTPLVLEVLSAFEAVAALFQDDLAGEAVYVTVDPAVTTKALKAVRDAICGSYARPILSKAEHTAMLRPWRTVYPLQSSVDEPDLGPRGDAVRALLESLPQLAARCHDAEGQLLFDALVDLSFVDEGYRAGARDSAFQAAVLTSRRRIWALVQRSGAEGISRPCYRCPPREDHREVSRVLELCADAACALLVADAVPDDLLEVLTRPLQRLIPHQR